MIIRSIELKSFGKFADRSFEFRRGLNIVVGPNEAGKSTLMESVPALFFGLRNKERFRPWGRHGSFEAALTVEGRGFDLRIERDLESDRVVLTERDDLYHPLYCFEGKAAPQGRSSERAEYLEQLTRLLGIAEEDVFRGSLFFGQGSLEVGGQGGLATRIKALLSGFVEVDYDRVLDSLREDYFALTRSNPWGKDKSKERELENVRGRIAELEKRWYEAQGALKELEGVRTELTRLTSSIEEDRGEFEKGERYLAWVRKQWALEEKEEFCRRDYNRVNRQAEKVGELEEKRKALEAELDMTGLPLQLPEELQVILAEAEEVRKELVALQGQYGELEEQLLAQTGPSFKAPVLAALLSLGAGGALAWLRPEMLTEALTGSGLAAGAFLFAYLCKAMARRSKRKGIAGRIQEIENEREEGQSRLLGLDGRFEAIGMTPSAVEVVRMQQNLLRHRELTEKLLEVAGALEVLEKSEELHQEKTDLTRKLAVIDERMEKERPSRSANLIPPEELPEAEEKLAALGESIKEREKALIELTRREAALQGSLGDLQQIEEEGELLKERESKLARKKNALAVAHDLLASSVDEFRQTYLDRFAADIGRHLEKVTGGRYGEVLLDESFSLSLKGRGGDWRPLEHYSRGTADAVYFAVRLALTRHLSKGRKLPLLLDDPLVNLDSGRLAETMSILEVIGQEHQVIFFTHDERMLRKAAQKDWNVVTMEEAVAAKTMPNRERREDVGQLSFL